MAEAARGAERILEGLNAPQTAAVTHETGPLLIIAGAGTGQTTVITRRIASLTATRRAPPEPAPPRSTGGAGPGKPPVPPRRIAYRIATRRARPSEILALTFTDKA